MLTLTTPALIFSIVSLLMIAYTTRFLGLATLIRSLHDKMKETTDPVENIQAQLVLLKKRVNLIKNMQIFAVIALILSIFSIVSLYFGFILTGELIFILSLLFLVISLILSIVEIYDSIRALELQLEECADGRCTL